MEWGEEFVVSISSKLAREGMMRLCIEIRLDADSEKLWAVQSGRFTARLPFLLLLCFSLPRSTLPPSFPPPAQRCLIINCSLPNANDDEDGFIAKRMEQP